MLLKIMHVACSVIFISLFTMGTVNAVSVGSTIPVCQFNALETGDSLSPMSLQQYSGKLIYVDFWASWCPPCRASFPFIEQLKQEYGQRGLEIVAISVDTDERDARRFLQQQEINFTVGIDSSGKCPANFQLIGMPSSYIIGRDGTIKYIHYGFKLSDQEKIKAEILLQLNGEMYGKKSQ